MALIKCSECGADVSEKASMCPKCGCPLDITKQVISDTKKNKKNKKIIFVAAIIVVIIAVISIGVFLGKKNNTPDHIAIRLIEKDFGKNISIESIYYNSEFNGCIVEFSADGKDNTAMVHLDDKIVGYKSVLDEYTEQSDNAKTDKEKLHCSQQLLDYMEIYDLDWDLQLILDPEKNGWEKIK